MRLFLVETTFPFRRLDLGLFEHDDEASCRRPAEKRHPFIKKLQCGCWRIEGKLEKGDGGQVDRGVSAQICAVDSRNTQRRRA
jgi:hypothetical protein